MKPRTLLCSHFWSIQQKAEFSVQDLTDRLKNNKQVFRALQAKTNLVPSGDLKRQWKRIIGLLGSGVHPSTTEILDCKVLFSKEPFSLANLSYAHMVSIYCKIMV